MESQRFNNISYLDPVDCSFDGYGSLREDSCPSMGSSFLTVNTSTMSFDEDNTDHKEPISPENLTMSSGVSATSPITPMGHLSLNDMPDTTIWPHYQGNDIWQHHGADAENLWLPTGESAMANCVMNSFSEQDSSVFQPGYFNLGRKQRTHPDPPLSRAMFANPTSQQINHTVIDGMLPWPQTVDLAYPMTIAPSVTFKGTLPSSPSSELESITPLRHHRGSSSMYASSPLTGSSSSILTSQWDMDMEETKYVPMEEASAYREKQSLSYLLRSSQDHSVKIEGSSPTESNVSKSGVDCEAIIPQNIYACSVPGCVDKNGRPKRFRRQEHKKRHEKTVHNKEAVFSCWVQTGGKRCDKNFTRRDNLNSHLKKTHGSRKNNQRNSYVATLDEKSEYFDDKWKGQLTADGLPLGHPRWPELR